MSKKKSSGRSSFKLLRWLFLGSPKKKASKRRRKDTGLTHGFPRTHYAQRARPVPKQQSHILASHKHVGVWNR